ncbi:Hypothetical predicted protein, partial [Prunus dulcis]
NSDCEYVPSGTCETTYHLATPTRHSEVHPRRSPRRSTDHEAEEIPSHHPAPLPKSSENEGRQNPVKASARTVHQTHKTLSGREGCAAPATPSLFSIDSRVQGA